jgi:hypothetical protein
MENINEIYYELFKNINNNYKKIKKILLDKNDKIEKETYENTFETIFNFFKNESCPNITKYLIDIIKYYLKYINNNDFNKLYLEINNKIEKNIDNKKIYLILKTFIITCRKAKLNNNSIINKNTLTNIIEKNTLNNIINKNNITYEGITTKNTIDKDCIDYKIENTINSIINSYNDTNKIITFIKKLSIYIDRKKNDNNSKITYNNIIIKINNIFEKILDKDNNNIIESLLVIINKCKKFGNIFNGDIESILYKCDNNIHDYIYTLNKDKENNEETLDDIKNRTIDFITKLGFSRKEFNDIDSLNLKRGFIFGLTKDNTDYILKYQPNKSTVELLINSYLKSLNISDSILIPNLFFINNDNSYFYIIEKYDTDLYKYFNLLDEKKIILSFKELLNIVYFIINTIVELHKNNIIHADLKLENVVLNVDENNKCKELKIIDFDVSVFNSIPNSLKNLPDKYNKIINNKKPRGTRIYMLKDQDMSLKNDIFSIGVIAIVLLYKNTKLLLSYRKSVDSKNIIKKLTTFRNNIEDNKIKLDMINVIEKYLKKENKKEMNRTNSIKYNKTNNNKNNFIDINIDIDNFKIKNEQYNKNLSFYRDNDIDKFKIFKNFIDDCINNRLDIFQIRDKYENTLFT